MKQKKVLKGMTLIEVLIAMVVMVVSASMLVLCAVSIFNSVRTSKSVVNKVNEQASVAENKAVIVPYETGQDIELQIVGDANSYTMKVDKFEVPTTQAPNDQHSGNFRYFVPVSGT